MLRKNSECSPYYLLKKQKNLILFNFSRIKSLFATNKLRLSAYPCTPSGFPKLTLWLSLLVLKHFFLSPQRKELKIIQLLSYFISLSLNKTMVEYNDGKVGGI